MLIHFLPADVAQILSRDLSAMADEVRATPDELLWKGLPGITNSVGTLAYHLCGNLQHFIGAVLGNSGYVRRREEEFNRHDLSKEELLQEIAVTIQAVTSALSSLTQDDLSKEMPDTPPQHKGRTVGYFLIQLCCHFSRHRGQLDYLRRMLSPA
jgi:uncharacterized damage-inducible protein DinB